MLAYCRLPDARWANSLRPLWARSAYIKYWWRTWREVSSPFAFFKSSSLQLSFSWNYAASWLKRERRRQTCADDLHGKLARELCSSIDSESLAQLITINYRLRTKSTATSEKREICLVNLIRIVGEVEWARCIEGKYQMDSSAHSPNGGQAVEIKNVI